MAEKTVKVTARHRTRYQNYRRADHILTKQYEEFDLTEKELEKFKADPHIQIKAEKEALEEKGQGKQGKAANAAKTDGKDK